MLAGLALVILSASLAGADIGPRTTIGKNDQQWSNTESANALDQGPVMHLIKSGEGPYVRFSNSQSAEWYVGCSISGRLQ